MSYLMLLGFIFLVSYIIFGVVILLTRISDSEIMQKERLITVIVPVRNEERSIIDLLKSISLNKYNRYEVYIVNDFSSDDTVSLVERFVSKFDNYHLINLIGKTTSPKKKAISQVISICQGEIIVTTDGDCIVPRDWLSKINNSFDEKTQMVLGGVELIATSFFQKMQQIEFAALIQVSLSMASFGKAFTCNGANLAYRKSAYTSVGGFKDIDHVASGDDELLMKKVAKKFPDGIRPLSNNWVKTHALHSFEQFLNQRVRWASKWKVSSAKDKLNGLYVVMVYLSVLCLPFVISSQVWFMTYAVLLFVKLLVDHGIASKSSRLDLLPVILTSLIYPFYAIAIGIASLFVKPKWKGRSIK